mmetsp:Transcript_41066/g.45878  ORF Transcript_41066/g.45878 Transcript_41066/m.45878 type:complete len:112 (+) Transcript_41066:649-984(+)
MQLLQDRNVLSSSYSRTKLVGLDGIRGRVVSSWDDDISQRNVGDTLNEIAHPVRMETDWKIYRRNRRDATSNLTAVNSYGSAWTGHRTFDSPSTIARGEVHFSLLNKTSVQ